MSVIGIGVVYSVGAGYTVQLPSTSLSAGCTKEVYTGQVPGITFTCRVLLQLPGR